MRFRKSMALGAAAVTAASLGATAVVGSTAAGASARGSVPVVTVHVGGGKIGVIGGNTLHAGRITFRVVTGGGTHILQIARLHRGYTLQEFGADIGQAFGGNTDAITRVDTKVTWRGGATTKPDKPGVFTVTLRHGTFYFFDQNSNAVRKVTVVGTPPQRPNVPYQSKITAFTYGFDSQPETIPAKGTVFFFNRADQPHFLEMQHVAAGTTRKMVTEAFQSNGQPTFIRRGSTGSGVISPTFGEMMRYDLPPGRYLIACFWPDRFTGMPHAFMGMFKLITLK